MTGREQAREVLAAAYERANLTCPAADVRSGNKVDWVREAVALDAIAAALSAREQGCPCPNCGKPVEVGHVVLPWDDAGEMHADCARPFALDVPRCTGEPEPVVLIGAPMRQFPLAALSSSPPSEREVELAEEWRREKAEWRGNDDLIDRTIAALLAPQQGEKAK